MASFYKIDDQTAAIRILQEQLRAISRADSRIPAIFIDGIYGAETENAVRSFQKTRGLHVSGTVDLKTHRALATEYNLYNLRNERFVGAPDFDSYKDGVISYGDKFDGVLALQLLFRSIAEQNDLFQIEADGVYGNQTATAVRLFKALRGAEINETVDRLFWNELVLFANRYDERVG